jgi:YegS/Rv2252/BmrU family lipid kinase
MPKPRKALLFFNPKSGRSQDEDYVEFFQRHFSESHIDLDIVHVLEEFNTLETIINTAIAEGVNLFVAAGGDGTVSMVSTHLVGKGKAVGIIPLGTGNLLAKALDVPQNIDEALNLITSSNPNTVSIDTLKLNERFFLMNVSVGITSRLMGSVDSQQKQKMGVFAYIINFLQEIFGLKLHKVYIDCDQNKFSVMASEVLITNIGTAGVNPLTWSDNILLNDGIMDLLIFRATNLWDILGIARSIIFKKEKFNPYIKFLKIRKYCRIETLKPLHTQADGDIIGKTPFEIEVIPQSLTIISGDNPHEIKKGADLEKL